MPNSIEDIIIEIESDSTEAVSQLDILTERLQALKKATSGSASLANFSKNFENLNRTLSWMNTIDPAKVESIKNFAEGASSLKGITISKSIGEQLEKINNSVMNFSPEAISTISEIANSMFLLKEMQGFVYPSGLNKGLENTAKLAQQISGNDFTKLRELVDIIRDLGTISVEDSSAMRQLSTSIKGFTTATKAASTRGRTFNTVLANIRTRTLGMIMGLRWVSRIMTSSLSVYGNYVEALNLYKMAIGEAAGEEYEFAENAQKLLGIDLTQWMQAQGVFNALAKGFGVANDKATLMSRNLTQLAYDISSFYNISVEDAIQKVQSGFAGQIRPVRNLGYDLSQARLEAIALANGIDEEVKSMTQAEKSQLRYIALMTQLTEVQGDLARTLDSPTNQMRLLNAQLDQMQRSIGLLLLPLLNKVIPYLNAMLRVIRMIAEEIAALFGYELPRLSGTDFSTNISMGADDIEESLEDATAAAEKLKNTLASFDQINLITSSSNSGGSGNGSSGGGSDLNLDLPSYDFLGGVTENQAQEIAESMMRKLRPYIEMLKDTIMWTYNHLDDIKTLLLTIAGVTVLGKIITGAQEAWKWFSEMNNILKGVGLVTIGVQFSYIGGKDIAKGDYLKGILEATLGTAAAMYGGALLLGPWGAMIGLSLSISMIYTGYQMQKEAEFRQEIQELFEVFDTGKQSLDNLTDSWSNFTSQFTENSDWVQPLIEAHDNINQIAISLGTLQMSYVTGQIAAERYSESLSTSFYNLKEKMLGYLQESRNALEQELAGPLGLAVIALGGTTEEVMNMFDTASTNLMQKYENLGDRIRQADEDFANDHDEKKYEAALDSISKELMILLQESGLTKDAFADLGGELDSFAAGVALEDLEATSEAIDKINKAYDEASNTLEGRKKVIMDALNAISPGVTSEIQATYDLMLTATDTFFNSQKEKLDKGYNDTMGVLEKEAVGRWARILDEEGLEGVKAYAENFFSGFSKQVTESYEKRDIPMEDTVFGELVDLMNEVEGTRKTWSMGGQTSITQKWKDLEEESKAFRSTLTGIYDAVDVNLSKFSDASSRAWDKTTTETKKGTSEFSQTLGATNKTVGSFGSAFNAQMNKIPDSVARNAMLAGIEMKNKGDQMILNARQAINSVVSTFEQNGQELPDAVKRIMAESQNMIKPVEFNEKGKKTASEFVTAFKNNMDPTQSVTDFKTKFSNMFQGDDAKKWGEMLGSSVKMGVEGGLTGTEKAMDFVFRGMAQSMNTFADRSYEYWTGMSNAIALAWNAVKLDTSGRAFVTLMGAYAKATAWHIKGYASGGFPNSADFFYANENGVPELVGTMGGRTAVANNQEITKGVADAVYKAIKDTGIANDVKRIASKDGKIVFAPSEEAGRVVSQSVNMYNRTGGRY